MKELKKLQVGQFLAVGNFLVDTLEISHPIVVDARIEDMNSEKTSGNMKESEGNEK